MAILKNVLKEIKSSGVLKNILSIKGAIASTNNAIFSNSNNAVFSNGNNKKFNS